MEIKVLPLFLEDAATDIELLDDVQCAKLLRALVKCDGADLKDDNLVMMAYKHIMSSASRAIEANRKRSDKMKGNQNARKQEPNIQV